MKDESSLPVVSDDDDDDDDDDAWDVVFPPDSAVATDESNTQAEPATLEITLQSARPTSNPRSSKARQLSQQRIWRRIAHQLHLVCLLKSASIRNKWINDPLLHARLLSLTPQNLQNNFVAITKKRVPDQARRGRLFETAIFKLTQWWHEEFFTINGQNHIKNRTFQQVAAIVSDTEIGERLRHVNSLMKHALMRRGSRDVSAILFTSLCRALDIPARLVVSLQPVPLVALKDNKQLPRNDSKGKRKATPTDGQSVNEDMYEVLIPDTSGNASSSSSIPTAKPSGSKTSPVTASESATQAAVTALFRKKKHHIRRTPVPSRSRAPVGGWPPTIWTEVFSRPDARWITVDAVRYLVGKPRLMEPPPHAADNRMTYVIAFEEDGYVRDITPRYAKDYWSKTVKLRISRKPDGSQWWEKVMTPLTRPYRLQRDDLEDVELIATQHAEGFPSSVAGFKDHPLYVLERHLKQNEAVYPLEEIGKFRGESVYPRANVKSLKTPESWMRVGRQIKAGCQPLKTAKPRAATINRKRALEIASSDGSLGDASQGLYSEAQTELYVPEPVIDGKVPKNNFGNIDLYTPSMLPAGAAHIPYHGVAKIARSLEFDFAEAVTGFEFRRGRAFPILDGIVVAVENEEIILEAFWESARDSEEQLQAKKRARAIRHWAKLIQGLRIQQRLQDQYGGAAPSMPDLEPTVHEDTGPGGFIAEAETVVQPFHLPRPIVNSEQKDLSLNDKQLVTEEESLLEPVIHTSMSYDENDADVFIPEIMDTSVGDYATGSSQVPITMDALAQLNTERLKYESAFNPSENDNKSRLETPPSKRRRQAVSSISTGRSLRTRKVKTMEQLRAEAEAEQAIREAIGE